MIKKILALVFVLATVAFATDTPRMGLDLIDDGTTPWGQAVRDNYSLIDSSAAILTQTNMFTGYNSFTSSVSFSSMTLNSLRISTATYNGTEKLVVSGDVKFFGPLGGSLFVCNSAGTKCMIMSNAGGQPAYLSLPNTAGTSDVLVRNDNSTNATLQLVGARGAQVMNTSNAPATLSAGRVLAGALFGDRISGLVDPLAEDRSAFEDRVYIGTHAVSGSPQFAVHASTNNAYALLVGTSALLSSSDYQLSFSTSGNLAVVNKQATGVFEDPESLTLTRLGNNLNCIGFRSSTDSFSTNPPWSICRSGTSLRLGYKAITGGQATLMQLDTAPGFPTGSTVTINVPILTGLAAGQCVQTGTGGLLTVTGSACGAGGGGGGGVSSFTYTFNPDQAKLPDLNPCAISNSTSAVTSSLFCDDSSSETVTWSTILNPYNGGALAADIYFTMASATTGKVYHNISVMCVTPGDAANLDTESFDTTNSTDTTVPGTAGFMRTGVVTLTNKDSCAKDDILVIKYIRDGPNANDTAAGDVRIRKIKIYEP